MGTFYADFTVENIVNRTKSAKVTKGLVDTGSEYTWVLGTTLDRLNIRREKKDVTFTMANGQRVTRTIGFAIVRVGELYTVDEVVFAEPGDMTLLGARSLEGLNLTVDPARKKLVASGPLPAARLEPPKKHKRRT